MEKYNVQNICTRGTVDLKAVPASTRKKLYEDGVIDFEDESAYLSLSYIERYDDLKDCVVEYTWDQDIENVLLQMFFPKNRTGKVLLLSQDCTWDHKNGYKVTDLDRVFARSNDVFQTVVSSNGKVCKIIESSHDKPTGHTVLAVSLTKKELSMASWDEKTFGEMYAWACAL